MHNFPMLNMFFSEFFSKFVHPTIQCIDTTLIAVINTTKLDTFRTCFILDLIDLEINS